MNNARLARPVSGSRKGDVGDRDAQSAVLVEQGELAKQRGEDEDEAGDQNGAYPETGHRSKTPKTTANGNGTIGQPQADPGRRPSWRRVGRSVYGW